MDEEEFTPGEFTRYQIILPEDDYDEDDEIDALIERNKHRQQHRVDRGFGIHGT